MTAYAITRNPSPTASVVYLSSYVSSDAAGALGYGATAPSGTDRTAGAQAFLDAAAGKTCVWDAAIGISAPLGISSFTRIIAPSPAYGWILRAGANCPGFRLKGMQTAPTTAGDAVSQKWFGKQDPANSGDPRYRVLDWTTLSGGLPQFLNNTEITIEGGTWNGNKAQQTSDPFTAFGFNALVQFYGCANVLIRGGLWLKPRSAIVMHFCNCRNVVVEGAEIDCSPLSTSGGPINTTGGVQFNGPCEAPLVVRDAPTHVDDDPWATNADDSTAGVINSTYTTGGSPCVAGVNWPQCGDILGAVEIDGHRISAGRENNATVSSGLGRVYSATHRVEKVIVRRQSGGVTARGFTLAAASSGTQITGAGNVGSLDIETAAEMITGGNSGGPGIADITVNADSIRIKRFRGTIPTGGPPDVSYAGNVITLTVEGDWYDPTTPTPVVAPIILVTGGTLYKVVFKGTTDRNSGVSAQASPVLKITGGTVKIFDFDGLASRITNIVKQTGGTLGAVVMNGAHAYANGGSPVDSAATITTAWRANLAFTGAFLSGGGAITHDGTWVDP